MEINGSRICHWNTYVVQWLVVVDVEEGQPPTLATVAQMLGGKVMSKRTLVETGDGEHDQDETTCGGSHSSIPTNSEKMVIDGQGLSKTHLSHRLKAYSKNEILPLLRSIIGYIK